MAPTLDLAKRQNGGGAANNNTTNYGDGGFWWSATGMAVRYAIVAVLLGSVLLFFLIGYYHAKRRLAKGQSPLAYHRWMTRQPVYRPTQQQHRYHYRREPPTYGYPMETYAPPPPAYNTAEELPPVYQPPQGGAKTMADESFREVDVSGGVGAVSGPPAVQGSMR